MSSSPDAGRLFLVDSIPKFTKDSDAPVLRLFTQVTPEESFIACIKTGSQNPFFHYLRIENAEGYVLVAIYLFICICVIRITKKVFNRIA